ncbi:uncharacterized protein A4U43_C04F35340 [Asparagus officinalis]|uniref:Photosystem I assembly factor PSA3, chloroplastic n=1 Tax=Asparagus officinalis TaxID=4686 RepID=A0A5P1F5X5_ASPOF|nr:uncharacterized protein LOC109839434 [Asparagus officinalis]ONK73785.1 uncharacterized protein A4U43_C04F35340 [Asparagus officinalis]
MGTPTLTATPIPNPNPNLASSLLSNKPHRFLLPKLRSSPRVKVGACLRIRAYMERNPNSIGSIASKVIGSLPVVGLLARILSDEGGVAGDVIDFAEFRRRVGKKCGISDSRAFYEFQDRRGRAGDPLYVLLCCWLAAVGAGLLKSEEILEGVARLRISNDIEFEEENFISMMNVAKEEGLFREMCSFNEKTCRDSHGTSNYELLS